MGDAVRPPILRSMAPGEEEAMAAAASATPKAAVVSMKDLKKQLADALARIQELEAENEKLKAENRALTRVVSKLTANVAATSTTSTTSPSSHLQARRSSTLSTHLGK